MRNDTDTHLSSLTEDDSFPMSMGLSHIKEEPIASFRTQKRQFRPARDTNKKRKQAHHLRNISQVMSLFRLAGKTCNALMAMEQSKDTPCAALRRKEDQHKWVQPNIFLVRQKISCPPNGTWKQYSVHPHFQKPRRQACFPNSLQSTRTSWRTWSLRAGLPPGRMCGGSSQVPPTGQGSSPAATDGSKNLGEGLNPLVLHPPHPLGEFALCQLSPTSAKKRLESLRDFAGSMKGTCLSESYRGCLVPLRWRCAEGHEWESTPNEVRSRGLWCPKCTGSYRPRSATHFSIQVIKALAEARGGQCLSESIPLRSTRLLWKCQEGHTWVAPVREQMRRFSWCPYCSRPEYAMPALRGRSRTRR